MKKKITKSFTLIWQGEMSNYITLIYILFFYVLQFSTIFRLTVNTFCWLSKYAKCLKWKFVCFNEKLRVCLSVCDAQRNTEKWGCSDIHFLNKFLVNKAINLCVFCTPFISISNTHIFEIFTNLELKKVFFWMQTSTI